MGKHRFRLCNMMPNAWFYKLRDMGRVQSIKSRSHHPPKPPTPTTPKPSHHPPPPPHLIKQAYLPTRPSYYYSTHHRGVLQQKLPCSPIHPKASDTHFPIDPPRSSKTRARRNPKASVSSGCSQHSESNGSSSQTPDQFGTELPPILTRPTTKQGLPHRMGGKIVTAEEPCKSPGRRPPRGIHRLRLSPRLGSRTAQPCRARKSSGGMQRRLGLPESLAVVVRSSDPQRDFRESMVEMIVENNIRAPKDLEELLACYLSLNSNEYHDVIVKVFEQIWFDLTDIRL